MAGFRFNVILVSACALVGFSAAPVFSQGYEGLIPNDKPAAQKPAPQQPADGTYSGLIPAPQQGGAPKGYSGVIPGEVPAAPVAKAPVAPAKPAQQETAVSAQPKKPIPGGMTPIPARRGNAKLTNDAIERLKNNARLSGAALTFEDVPPGPAGSIAMVGNAKRPRIGGLSPMEFMIRQQVSVAMATLKNPNLSDAQKKEKARESYRMLTTLSTGVSVRKRMAEDAAQKNDPATRLLQGDADGSDSALARLQVALKALEPYQK